MTAACQMAGAKLSCSPAGTAGHAPGPSSREGSGGRVKSPSELAKEPGPESTEVKGSHMVTSTVFVPRPGAASLLINQPEKCRKWQW